MNNGQKEYKFFKLPSAGYYPFVQYELLKDKSVVVLKLPGDYFQPGSIGLDDFTSLRLAQSVRKALHCLTALVTIASNDSNIRGGFVPVFETVARKHRAQEVSVTAGYRLWIFYDPVVWNPGAAFDEMIQNNAATFMKSIGASGKSAAKKAFQPTHAKQASQSTYLHTRLDNREDYLDMCGGVNPGINYFNSEACLLKPLQDEKDNDATPISVFSIINAMNNFPGADWTCLKHTEYQPNPDVRQYKFPFPNRVWRLSVGQLRPDNFLRYCIPTFRPPLSEIKDCMETDEGRMYSKMVEADAIRLVPDEQQAQEHYYRQQLLGRDCYQPRRENFNYVIATQMQSGTVLSIESLAEMNAAQRLKIQTHLSTLFREGKVPIAEIFKEGSKRRRAFEVEAVNNFRAIWHENVPDTMISQFEQATIKWGVDYLKKHKNLCWRQQKITSNMSLKAEWAIQQILRAEFLYFCHVAHEITLLVTLSAYDAYYPSNDKLHLLLVGPPGVAKSFALIMDASTRIPGTTDILTSKSSQSDTGSGCLNGYNEKWHEIDEKKLGVLPPNGRAGPTDAETNNFKMKLTECYVARDVTELNKEAGGRQTIKIRIQANGTVQGATNCDINLIPLPTQDRFMIQIIQEFIRPDKTLQQCMEAAANSKERLKELHESAKLQSQLMQYRVCLAGMMMRVNLLPKVDTSWASKIFAHVTAKVTEETGQKMKSRLNNRMIAVARNLTLINAIWTVFDSDLSPIREKPFEFEDMLLLTPYLTAGTQEAIMTLGFFRSELESDRLINQILRTLLDVYFPLMESKNGVQAMDTTSDYASSMNQAAQARPVAPPGNNWLIGREDVPQYASTIPGYLCIKDVFKPGTAQKTSGEKRARDVSSSDEQPNAKRARLDEKQREIEACAMDFQQEDSKAELPHQNRQPFQPFQQFQPAQNARPFSNNNNHAEPAKKKWDKITLIAKQLLVRMNPKPEMKTLKRCLFQLTEMTVAGSLNDYIMVLSETDNHLYISKERIQNLGDDLVKRSLLDILQHEYTKPRRFAFDFSRNSSTPYLFNSLDVWPIAGKKPGKFINPNYADAKQVTMIELISKNDKGDAISVKDAYDRAAFTEIGKTDPEDIFFYEHLKQQLWTAEDMKKYGFDLPTRMDALAVGKVADPSRLPLYPEEAAVSRDKAAFEDYIAKTRGNHQADYSCDIKFERLKLALGF